MEKNEIEVLDALKKWGIAFEYKEHSPLFSMDDYAEIEKEMTGSIEAPPTSAVGSP